MIYIFLALILYTGVIIFATFATRNAGTQLVTAIENLLSALVPILTIIPVINKTNYQNQKLGIIAAVVAGILIALFSLAMNKAYTINKVAIVAPIVFGGSIMLSAILSHFIFKEKITLTEGLGLLILGGGLLIIVYARFTGK